MERVAVLASGGLDSAVLIADLAREAEVFPVYVQMGLAWEEQERKALVAFLGSLETDRVRPLTVLPIPVRSMYGSHWSLSGEGVPGADSDDREVMLPGRNILLFGATAVWCSIVGISRIAIGSLAGNPFPDATDEFFHQFGRALGMGLEHPIELVAPYRGTRKAEIIRRFSALRLERTLTCMSPGTGTHCGDCNKCFERQKAFEEAGIDDLTTYRTRG